MAKYGYCNSTLNSTKTPRASLILAFAFICARPCAADTNLSGANGFRASVKEKDREYRLKWNLETLVGDYDKHGHHNPKWDESARAALHLFAELRNPPNGSRVDLETRLKAALRLATTNGCDDALVLYLSARYLWSDKEHDPKEHAEAYRSAAVALSRGDYTSIRKFYGCLRAAEALKPTNATPSEVHTWRNGASYYLTNALTDKTMPPVEVYQACSELLTAVQNNGQQMERFYRSFEPIIFANWPSEPSLYLLKGTFYRDYAWQGRGTDWARNVKPEQWALFEERLAIAEQALNKAWEMNPKDERIATAMINVELGQGRGRERMEQWFNRAMDLNTNCYEACATKRYYLEPKWHGSPDDMLEFAHECVNSKKWGGRVPLILLDAHVALEVYLTEAERKVYWKQPEVWQDINAAFEKFFALNPKQDRWRHTWALYAYRAEQWDTLNRQLPLLGKVSYGFFGGKDEFDRMVNLAREHARE